MPRKKKNQRVNNKKKKGQKKTGTSNANKSGGGGAKAPAVRNMTQQDNQQYWPGFRLSTKIGFESLYGSIELYHTPEGCLSTTIKNPNLSVPFFNLSQHILAENNLFILNFQKVFQLLLHYTPKTMTNNKVNEDNYILEVLNETSILLLFVLANAFTALNTSPTPKQAEMVLDIFKILGDIGNKIRNKKNLDHLAWYYISRIDYPTCDLLVRAFILDSNYKAASEYMQHFINELVQIKTDSAYNIPQLLLPRILLQLLSIPQDKSPPFLTTLITKALETLNPDTFKGVEINQKARFLSLVLMTFFQPIHFQKNGSMRTMHAYEFILNYYPNQVIKAQLEKLILTTLDQVLKLEKKSTPCKTQKTTSLPDQTKRMLATLRTSRWKILNQTFTNIRTTPIALVIQNGIQKLYTDCEERYALMFAQLWESETKRYQQIAQLIEANEPIVERKPAELKKSVTVPPAIKKINSPYDLYAQFIQKTNCIDPKTGQLPDEENKLASLFELFINPLFQRAENELALLLNTLGPLPYLWFHALLFNKQLRMERLLENTTFLFHSLPEADRTILSEDPKLLNTIKQRAYTSFSEYPSEQAHKFIQTWVQGSKTFRQLGYPTLFFNLIKSTQSPVLEIFLTSLHYYLIKAPLNLFHCRKHILDKLHPERLQKNTVSLERQKEQESISQIYHDTLPKSHAQPKRTKKQTKQKKAKKPQREIATPTGGGGKKELTAWDQRFHLADSHGEVIPQATEALNEIIALLQPLLESEELFLFMRSSQVIDESPHSDFDLLALFPDKITIEKAMALLIASGFLTRCSTPVSIVSMPPFTAFNGTYKGVPFDFQLAELEGNADEELEERITRSTKIYNKPSTNRTSFLGELAVKKFKRLFIPSKPDTSPGPTLSTNLVVFQEFIGVQISLVKQLLANSNLVDEFKQMCSNFCLVIKEALRLFVFNRQSSLPSTLDQSTVDFVRETEKLVLTKAGKETFLRGLEAEITERVFETRATPSSMIYLLLQQLNSSVAASPKERPLLQSIAHIANTRAIKRHRYMMEQVSVSSPSGASNAF